MPRQEAVRDGAWRAVSAVLPERDHDLARLSELARGGEPTVTVVGKYNHGKSRLLNELLGRDLFAVADERETVTLSRVLHDGAAWLDAPGLDADVGVNDDRHALLAVWLKSDIRLFVHAAKEGELDSSELELLEALSADERRARRRTVVVLSQVDQVADEAELRTIVQAIGRQVPGLRLHAVSATRHRQGVDRSKPVLLERSGIPPLRLVLDEALARVPDARIHEAGLLIGEIRADLEQLRAVREQALQALRDRQMRQRRRFDQGLEAVLARVGREIEEVVTAPVPDHAIVADTAGDKYRVTQAKAERARIQIGYSRACIQIDAFLAGEGVAALPSEQQIAAGSLNTVMVAVMGVAVLFREDLRRRFCDPAGRARMSGEFTRYFELSRDRTALRAEIESAEADLAATAHALASLSRLDIGT